MQLVEHQLRDQEDFIIGIKLNLAQLNKAHSEKASSLKFQRQKNKGLKYQRDNLLS